MASALPYIVLMGDVGSGKSTLLEKLTGVTGRSSAASTRVTLTTEVIKSYDGRLLIADTPGTDSVDDTFDCNLHIAQACSFRPLTCLLIVVRAEPRINNVLRSVRDCVVRFVPDEIPLTTVGVCVTHMDQVSWAESDLPAKHFSKILDMTTIIFSSLSTQAKALSQEIRSKLATHIPVKLQIGSGKGMRSLVIKSSSTKPYIVLLGNVGVGKSTIVEKLTGTTGRSSCSELSFTRSSEVFESYDGCMIICDTPGTNSMTGSFQHNIHIAHAINFRPVSCILVVVKADVKMDNVVTNIIEHAEGLLAGSIPFDLLLPCVTHMETPLWTDKMFLNVLKEELGINSAVFSSLQTSRGTLTNDLLFECANRMPVALSIDSDMFLKIFRLSHKNLGILRQSQEEVNRFKAITQAFLNMRRDLPKADQMDVTFEFQAWLHQEVIEAQKRLSHDNHFAFLDDTTCEVEAGHVKNMSNQLNAILRDVRLEALQYLEGNESDFRRCPYCGAVWTKVEGCAGKTTCGRRAMMTTDSGIGNMATFMFEWASSNQHLTITKNPSRKALLTGCGHTIEWTEMAPVSVPDDFFTHRVESAFRHAYKRAADALSMLKINAVKK